MAPMLRAVTLRRPMTVTGVTLFVAVACSGNPESGEGGGGGTSGSAAAAGGTAGVAGGAGLGGAGPGGTGGQAGAGASAGAGGTSGAASDAGSTEGGPGDASDAADASGAGDAADGADAGASMIPQCAEECQQTSDCGDPNLVCESNRCVDLTTCASDLECIIGLSNFAFEGCTSSAACPSVGVCILFMGKSYCAVPYPSFCFGSEIQALPLVEGGTEDVCVAVEARCRRQCYFGCTDSSCPAQRPHCNSTTRDCECTTSPDSCGADHTCNATTGQCECANDNACASVSNASVCVNGRCECASSADCTANADVCIDGECGCSSATACTDPKMHPGTTYVCSPSP